MVQLVIDSSNNHLSVCIIKKNKVLSEINTVCKQNLSEIILQKINECIENSSVKKDDISEIIVTRGPGSYTALRVVLSVAKTFSYVLNIPIKLISTLKLQMLGIKNFSGLVVPLIDGRRNNVYTAVYYKNDEILKEGYYSLDTLFDFLNLQFKPVMFIGNDIDKFSYNDLKIEYKLHLENIFSKNIIGAEKILEESNFYTANPSYLRLTEAERSIINDKN